MKDVSFETTENIINTIVNEDVISSIDRRYQSRSGDIVSVANFEEYNESEHVETEQHFIRFVSENDNVHAKAIIYLLEKDNSVAHIDWIEVVRPEHRGEGIGRSLFEEIVQYLDKLSDVETIYIKLENSNLQRVVLDTGFIQMDSSTTAAWYIRE